MEDDDTTKADLIGETMTFTVLLIGIYVQTQLLV